MVHLVDKTVTVWGACAQNLGPPPVLKVQTCLIICFVRTHQSYYSYPNFMADPSVQKRHQGHKLPFVSPLRDSRRSITELSRVHDILINIV